MRTSLYLRYAILLALVSCDAGIDPAQPGDFAIFHLKDPTLTASHVWDLPLENLVLADTPMISLGDLTSYRWSTHEFTVTASVDSHLAQFKRGGPVGGIPFVVIAGNERVYLGAIWYGYSSLIPQVPYIDIIFNPHRICKCESVLILDDKRTDARIYSVLKSSGILID